MEQNACTPKFNSESICSIKNHLACSSFFLPSRISSCCLLKLGSLNQHLSYFSHHGGKANVIMATCVLGLRSCGTSSCPTGRKLPGGVVWCISVSVTMTPALTLTGSGLNWLLGDYLKHVSSTYTLVLVPSKRLSSGPQSVFLSLVFNCKLLVWSLCKRMAKRYCFYYFFAVTTNNGEYLDNRVAEIWGGAWYISSTVPY